MGLIEHNNLGIKCHFKVATVSVHCTEQLFNCEFSLKQLPIMNCWSQHRYCTEYSNWRMPRTGVWTPWLSWKTSYFNLNHKYTC